MLLDFETCIIAACIAPLRPKNRSCHAVKIPVFSAFELHFTDFVIADSFREEPNTETSWMNPHIVILRIPPMTSIVFSGKVACIIGEGLVSYSSCSGREKASLHNLEFQGNALKIIPTYMIASEILPTSSFATIFAVSLDF